MTYNTFLFSGNLPGDEEMTLDDVAMYAAGQLDIYYQCQDRGTMTIKEIAEQLGIHYAQLIAIRPVWIECGVMERRDTMKEMLIAAAEDYAKAEREKGN